MRSSSSSGTAVAEPTAVGPAARPDPSVRVHPFRFDATVAVDVPLVPWPRGRSQRAELVRRDAPCLLVVGIGDPAPCQWSETEDWVRRTAPHAEFVTRATTVARRADLRARPHCDRCGRVTFRARTVTVPDTQVALVALLVERFGDIVGDENIRALCKECGASTDAEAVKTSLRRIKRGLAPLGLRLSRVRAAGYLLDRVE